MKINERISKFKITSVDGNTLVINEEGIIPTRGLRAKMKVEGIKINGTSLKQFRAELSKKGFTS